MGRRRTLATDAGLPEVTLTIDGREVTVPEGTLVINAAEAIGIYIPRFCYHKRLEPAGACRMCLVEIEGFPKPQTSCTVSVKPGMVVHTDTEAVRQMRASILEFILMHHPLDCPVCDKGGECDLQDLTLTYGTRLQRHDFPRMHFRKAYRIGGHIVLDQERCIECYRCVRFLEEWGEGLRFAFHERGDRSVIETFGALPMVDTRFVGNTIDLCPVGALTSETFRFRGRPAELVNAEAICPHCSVGCNIIASARPTLGFFCRVTPRPNMAINDYWICDRGRFDYDWLDEGRLLVPEWGRGADRRSGTWDEALDRLASDLDPSRGGNTALLVDSSVGCEDGYVAAKVLRGALGSNAIYQSDPAAGMSGLTGTISDVARCDLVLAVGLDLWTELPVLWLRIYRSRHLGRSRLVAVTAGGEEDLARCDVGLRVSQGAEAELLSGLAELRAGADDPSRADALAARAGADPALLRRLVRRLRRANRVAVLAGAAAGAAGLAGRLASVAGAGGVWGVVPTGANTIGLDWVGVASSKLPGGVSLGDAGARAALAEAWSAPVAAEEAPERLAEALRNGFARRVLVVGGDPIGAGDRRLSEELGRADVVAYIGTNRNATAERADYVFPMAAFSETERSTVSLERRMQHSAACDRPRGQSRPGWWILAGLGRRLGAGFHYGSFGEVRLEIAACHESLGPLAELGPRTREGAVKP